MGLLPEEPPPIYYPEYLLIEPCIPRLRRDLLKPFWLVLLTPEVLLYGWPMRPMPLEDEPAPNTLLPFVFEVEYIIIILI